MGEYIDSWRGDPHPGYKYVLAPETTIEWEQSDWLAFEGPLDATISIPEYESVTFYDSEVVVNYIERTIYMNKPKDWVIRFKEEGP